MEGAFSPAERNIGMGPVERHDRAPVDGSTEQMTKGHVACRQNHQVLAEIAEVVHNRRDQQLFATLCLQ